MYSKGTVSGAGGCNLHHDDVINGADGGADGADGGADGADGGADGATRRKVHHYDVTLVQRAEMLVH